MIFDFKKQTTSRSILASVSLKYSLIKDSIKVDSFSVTILSSSC